MIVLWYLFVGMCLFILIVWSVGCDLASLWLLCIYK